MSRRSPRVPSATKPDCAGSSTRCASADRAVSITLNYVLALAISALLVTGLLIAGGTFVQDQRERVIESELTVVGTHLAGNLEQVDRMVQAHNGSDPDRVYINQTFQRDVTGANYRVTLSENPAQVVLRSTSPDITVRVNATVRTELATGSESAGGGRISIFYDPNAGSDGQLVIADV